MGEIPKSDISFWISNNLIIAFWVAFLQKLPCGYDTLVETDFYQKYLGCYSQANQDVVKGLLVMWFYHIRTHL